MGFQEYNQLWDNADYKFKLALVVIDYFSKLGIHIIANDEFSPVLLSNIGHPLDADHRITNRLIQNLKDADILKKIDIYSEKTSAFALTQNGINIIFYNQKKIICFIQENNIDLNMLPKFVYNNN